MTNMDLLPLNGESSRDLDMATFCQPKITMVEFEQAVDALTRERNDAVHEAHSLIEELRAMTTELESVTKTMKEQSDAIDTHLKIISSQKTEIEDLEARIAALEKDDPDLSIYEDTMEPETERQDELDAVNTAVVLVLAVSICMIATIAVVGVPLSDTDL